MPRHPLCLSLLLLLAACQSALDARVTRYSGQPPVSMGQTFAIQPEAQQAGNLEFRHFAGMVAAHLQALGLKPLPREGAPADLEVTISYADAGRYFSYFYDPGPYWAGWGGVGGSGWWGWSGGYSPDINGYTRYAKTLEVDLFDGPAWRAGERRMVWQGKVFGESPVADLNTVMPAMMVAVFRDFPGQSGQTAQLSVPLAAD